MKHGKGFEVRKLIMKKAVLLTAIAMSTGFAGCSKQFARIEDNQAQLKLMAQTNAEQLAAITEFIGQNQNELTAKIQQVRNETKVLADNQESLKAGLVVSHNETAKIANDVTALDRKQSELYNTVQANNSRLTEKVNVLEQGQNTLLAGIEDSKNHTLQVSSEVAALGDRQVKLHETSQNSIQQVNNNLSQVAKNQESLKAGLVVSHNETAKIANDVTALDRKQSELYNTVQANNSRLTEKVNVLEQGQNTLLAGIEDSKNQTLKVSSEVAALAQAQAKLNETSSLIANNISQLFNNQEVLKAGLVVSHNETAKVANNLSRVAGNQEILKAGLVVSHNETAKAANNLAALGDLQKELNGIVQNSNSSLSERVAVIEKNQSDLQTGIENVRNETREVAASVSAVGTGQVNLKETVENYNQQLTDRVVVVEQSQHEWQTTIKQMQESISDVAGNINTFEKNLSKLHEIFQSNMSDLNTAANKNSQGQLEFQEKIKKDLLALADSVTVIKQGQNQLQQKVADVKSNTESIAAEFPAAIEQLRKEMTAEEEEAYSSNK